MALSVEEVFVSFLCEGQYLVRCSRAVHVDVPRTTEALKGRYRIRRSASKLVVFDYSPKVSIHLGENSWMVVKGGWASKNLPALNGLWRPLDDLMGYGTLHDPEDFWRDTE